MRAFGPAKLRASTALPRARTVVQAASNGAQQTIGFDDLVDVIKAVDTSDVIELELKGKKFAMTVRKHEALVKPEPIYISAPQNSGQAMQQAAPAAPAPAAAAPAAPAAAAAPAAPAVLDGIEVISPMAGTVYRSAAPGEPLFVKEGDKVSAGQTICIIEAMKLMNEIEAEVSGTLIKFVADNNKMVGAGDVLVVIKP